MTCLSYDRSRLPHCPRALRLPECIPESVDDIAIVAHHNQPEPIPMRLRKAAVTLGGSLLPTLAIAAPDMQAAAFIDIYASHCIKYLHDFDGLRKQMGPAPQLSADKAAVFLKGSRGSAWMVPSPHGQFILVINTEKKLCALYAKTVPAAAAQELFEKVVGNAPAPFRSENSGFACALSLIHS